MKIEGQRQKDSIRRRRQRDEDREMEDIKRQRMNTESRRTHLTC